MILSFNRSFAKNTFATINPLIPDQFTKFQSLIREKHFCNLSVVNRISPTLAVGFQSLIREKHFCNLGLEMQLNDWLHRFQSLIREKHFCNFSAICKVHDLVMFQSLIREKHFCNATADVVQANILKVSIAHSRKTLLQLPRELLERV